MSESAFVGVLYPRSGSFPVQVGTGVGRKEGWMDGLSIAKLPAVNSGLRVPTNTISKREEGKEKRNPSSHLLHPSLDRRIFRTSAPDTPSNRAKLPLSLRRKALALRWPRLKITTKSRCIPNGRAPASEHWPKLNRSFGSSFLQRGFAPATGQTALLFRLRAPSPVGGDLPRSVQGPQSIAESATPITRFASLARPLTVSSVSSWSQVSGTRRQGCASSQGGALRGDAAKYGIRDGLAEAAYRSAWYDKYE